MNTINLRALYDNYKDTEYPIWHPFSHGGKNVYNTINIKRGRGIYLYDVDDKRYIDASSGLWNISLGYDNEIIKKQLIAQLSDLPYCSLFDHTNNTAIKCANMLLEILPEQMKKIFFTCSGSESIEVSLKIMRKYWKIKGMNKKDIIISLKDSYHGSYYGSMSVSGIEQEQIKDFGPLLNGIKFFSAGICDKCENKASEDCCSVSCINELEDFVKKNTDRIAGIIIEPILASKGVQIISSKYINNLQSICDKYDILFTVDEVATGFYRAGDAFYTQKFKVKPDIICMAKGINSGYLPLGAIAVSKKIYDTFSEQEIVLEHGSTQGGNTLACAATIAAIQQYSELNIATNVKIMGTYFKKQIESQLSSHRNIGPIRGEGLLFGVDLVKNKKCNEYLNSSEILAIQEYLKKSGLIVYRSDTGLSILPMLIVSKAQLDNIIDILVEVFKSILF
jgi:adenosylmethionine-8-amino-7-oxononanoate aminotransferase